MSTYRDHARDLRRLADVLDANADDLPLPEYASQDLEVNVFVPEARDVFWAGDVLEVKVSEDNHITATTDTGTARMRFIYIPPEATAKYEARQSYSENLVTS